jgi:hypothetical protein
MSGEDLTYLKERLLITDGTYDTQLTHSIEEAVRYIVEAIKKHDSTFTSSSEYIAEGTMLWDVTLDIAAGIFKRRHMPQDMDQGWWGQGLKKLEIYILGTYGSGIVYFPDGDA